MSEGRSSGSGYGDDPNTQLFLKKQTTGIVLQRPVETEEAVVSQ